MGKSGKGNFNRKVGKRAKPAVHQLQGSVVNKSSKTFNHKVGKREKPVVHQLQGFVVNKSSKTFSEKQQNLLNMGLNFAISPQPDLEQVIVDVETAINNCDLPPSEKVVARNDISEVLKSSLPTCQNKEDVEVIRELKNKGVYFIEADKGNSVVVMDKEDYDSQMMEKINNGPYRKQRVDPLPSLIKKVDTTVKECKKILGDDLGRLKVSCPSLPRIKGLPKVHKPGNEMREIVSAVGSPTQKIAKWLVQEFKNVPKQFQSRSVSNTQDFTRKLLESGEISQDEEMVSFDVSALFPSIPVKESINLLEDWLMQQNGGTSWRIKVLSYLKLTRLCMEENYFTFRGEFFKQTQGAPMGNPLSPFLSELFMANLEKELEEKGLLPEKWWRYVDDIFCIIKKDSLPVVLDVINNAHKNIKFTCERENEGKLPFLDIIVIRQTISPVISQTSSSDTPFKFEIYRKPTNTQRIIPNTSNHSFQHKMAAFHHMLHRMDSLPLSPEGREKELSHIFEVARLNGYTERSVKAIINKRSRVNHRRTFTTLLPIKDNLKRRSSIFVPELSSKLNSKLRKFGIDLVFSSTKNQLKSLLGSTKDPVNSLGKSGIYEIKCQQCEMTYIGQTKRTLETRFKEHVAEITKATKEVGKGLTHAFKSTVAEHSYTKSHTFSTDDIRIIRHIHTPGKLDVAESLEIIKRNPNTLLNRDSGNGFTPLFDLLPNNSHKKKKKKNPKHNNDTLLQTYYLNDAPYLNTLPQ